MGFSIKLNHSEVQSYLDGDHGVEAILEAKAQEALSRAQGAAPVVTGAYQASLHIETDHTDRMVKRVVADVDYAMVVEAQHGVLGKALG